MGGCIGCEIGIVRWGSLGLEMMQWCLLCG